MCLPADNLFSSRAETKQLQQLLSRLPLISLQLQPRGTVGLVCASLETSLPLSGSQPYTCLASESWGRSEGEESCGLGWGVCDLSHPTLVDCQSFPKASGLNSWGRQALVLVHLDSALTCSTTSLEPPPCIRLTSRTLTLVPPLI